MHFPVMVLTEKGDYQSVRNLLAPFDEHLAAETYVEFTYPELKEKLDRMCWEEYDGRYYDRLREALENDDIEEIRAINREFDLFFDINERGEALDGYNPQKKWDFWGGGGRWPLILNGKVWCLLKDFPRIRDNDTESELGDKFPMYYDRWKETQSRSQNRTDFLHYLKEHCRYDLLTPDGSWLEPKGDWTVRYNQILDSYPQDWTATLVDCHI